MIESVVFIRRVPLRGGGAVGKWPRSCLEEIFSERGPMTKT